MENLNKEEIGFFNNFFINLKLSKQMRKEFLEWIPEICYADGISLKEVLHDKNIMKIFTSEKINNPQKIKKIHALLYKMRFPELSLIKEKWSKKAKKITGSEKSIKIKTDPYFEKTGVEIILSARNSDDLMKILNKLSLIEKSEWDYIIDPISIK